MAEWRQSRIVGIPGGYHVWTHRIGHGDRKVLMLHGGPGASHEYLEPLGVRLADAGYEVYLYDQLGSYGSDQPDDLSLWTVERFREEVEAVRKALHLEDFVLFGQSWGGMLAIEYALAYQEHLKAAVISNMTASIASYVAHINDLRERLPKEIQTALAAYEERGEFQDPVYLDLLTRHLYNAHLCRLDPWPAAVVDGFAHIWTPVYGTMQGPSEFVVNGTFKDWDRWGDLGRIRVPALLLVGAHDTMRPADVEEMARRIPGAAFGLCPEGSHLAMFDDPETYFAHLASFLAGLSW